jgi:hypothetical protein
MCNQLNLDKMGKRRFIIIMTVMLIVYACKHKPDIVPCLAGTGGSLSIVAYATHAGISIPNYFTHFDTAFVKFGTLSSPGKNPANYDTNYVSNPGEDHIHCYGLKCGDYFIYRVSISDSEGGKSIIVPVN